MGIILYLAKSSCLTLTRLLELLRYFKTPKLVVSEIRLYLIGELVSVYGELFDIDQIMKQRGHADLFYLPRVRVILTGTILISL